MGHNNEKKNIPFKGIRRVMILDLLYCVAYHILMALFSIGGLNFNLFSKKDFVLFSFALVLALNFESHLKNIVMKHVLFMAAWFATVY